jgi:hypothetical protein
MSRRKYGINLECLHHRRRELERVRIKDLNQRYHQYKKNRKYSQDVQHLVADLQLHTKGLLIVKQNVAASETVKHANFNF